LVSAVMDSDLKSAWSSSKARNTLLYMLVKHQHSQHRLWQD
jgi:hypothetical protein